MRWQKRYLFSSNSPNLLLLFSLATLRGGEHLGSAITGIILVFWFDRRKKKNTLVNTVIVLEWHMHFHVYGVMRPL